MYVTISILFKDLNLAKFIALIFHSLLPRVTLIPPQRSSVLFCYNSLVRVVILKRIVVSISLTSVCQGAEKVVWRLTKVEFRGITTLVSS